MSSHSFSAIRKNTNNPGKTDSQDTSRQLYYIKSDGFMASSAYPEGYCLQLSDIVAPITRLLWHMGGGALEWLVEIGSTWAAGNIVPVTP